LTHPADRTTYGMSTPARDQHIVVIGLGYVGLPLAAAFTEAGATVTGIDLSPARVAALRAGRSPIEDIDDTRLGSILAAGFSVCHTDAAGPALAGADAIFVCVPTPVTASKDPDLVPILAAGALIGGHVRAGTLVILQSTTFPGTTMGPFREAIEQVSGLRAGHDFELAFAPERINPGDPVSAGRTMPRLVGGSTLATTTRAAALLRRINDTVIELSSPDAAEAAKLLENTFRNVNIAFVNQLALLCERMGLDAWEVIDAASTKPFGFMRFTPGPGVGGHCIPVDPYYLAWRARQFGFTDRFIELAGDINDAMPRHVVDLAATALNERGKALRGARVGVIGVAFKPNVGDARTSPSAPIIAGLAERGAFIAYHDPHVPTFHDATGTAHSSVSLDELLAASDLVIVLTAHEAIDLDRVYTHAGLVLDTVNSSKGRRLHPRSVLRLGAGWNDAVPGN
jgi:UDP-N-acetyl-D-glucosamine dehydrogenase